MPLRLVATCALGLEEILAGELVNLGAAGVESQRGAVAFHGDWLEVMRANWRLRTANRVLVELASWDGASAEALAAGAQSLLEDPQLAWGGLAARRLFHPDRTLAVRATSSRSRIRDTRWVALKVKDGLVDGQRQRFGRRSSVSRSDPDTPLRLWLYDDRATLLLDTSGEPLDRRGYRRVTTAAPVREQLAAAAILASGWSGQGQVVDPMCGSGTLLAEAASMALGWAPGRLRQAWAFERLPGFDRGTFETVQREPILAPDPEVRLFGNDRSAEAVEATRTNLEAAGLLDRTTLTRGDCFAGAPPAAGSEPPGLVAVNPAYGERLEEGPEQWRRLGDLLKQGYPGFRAVVLAGGEGRGKHLGLRPHRRLPVKNGPLEARILVFELY